MEHPGATDETPGPAPASVAPPPERTGNSDQATLRGSFVMLAGRLVSAGIGLVTQALIIKAFGDDTVGKAQYGTFTTAVAAAALVQSFLALGLDRADTRFLTRYDEEGDTGRILGMIATETLTILGMSALTLGLVVATDGAVLGGDNSSVPMSVLLVVLCMAPLAAWDGVVVNFFATFSRPMAVFVRRYVLDPGLKLVVVVTVVLLGISARSMAVGYLVAGVVGTVLYLSLLVPLLRRILREGAERGAVHRFAWPGRTLFAFALPLLTSAVVRVATLRVPMLVLPATAGVAAAGELAAAQVYATVIDLVPQVFGTLFLPRAARLATRGEAAATREHYWATATWTSVLAFPLACLVVGFPGAVVRDLMGDGFAVAAPSMAVMGIACYLNAALGLNSLQLQVEGKVAQITASNVVGLVLAVAGSALLAGPFGAFGTAVAVAVALLVPTLMRQWALRGLGIGAVDRATARVWALVAVLLALQFTVDALFAPPLWAAFGSGAVLSVVLVFVVRDSLAVDEVLPMMAPVVRLLDRVDPRTRRR